MLFTQESDTFVPKALVQDELFLSVGRQNPKDGTFIFLRSDLWEPDYEVIPVDEYKENGCMNVIMATRKDTGQKFLLASCHGHSTKPEDGRHQITLIMEIYNEMSKHEKNLQLLIGTDANTKRKPDEDKFREHLDLLGLMATDVGTTTVKRRMETVQHDKAGRYATDQEDYLVTLKPENGGQFQFEDLSVSFKPLGDVDMSMPLPNIDNLSDHYPVGARLSQLN